MCRPVLFRAVIFLFIQRGRPLPISAVNPTGNPAYLAIPIVLSILLLALLAVLRYFWRRGRHDHIKHILDSNPVDNTYTSIMSCDEKTRAPFWVGFFGSPERETEYQGLRPPSNDNASYPYSMDTQSKRSRRPSSRYSVIDTSDPASPALSAILDTRALYNIPNRATPKSLRSQSLRSPAYPDTAKVSTKARRHTSLPSGCISPTWDQDDRTRPRHRARSGSRSSRSRRSTGSRMSRESKSPPLPCTPEFPPPFTPSQIDAISPLSPIELGFISQQLSHRPPSSRRIRSSPHLAYRSTPCSPIAELSPEFQHPYSLSAGRISRRNPGSFVYPIPEAEPVPPLPTHQSNSPPLPSFPVNYAAALHSKPRAKRIRSRTTSSPTIGPSPLRNLVNPSEGIEIGGPSSTPSATSQYNSIGLGFPSSLPALKHEKNAGDANVLRDILRELVQETSAWDPSMHVNQNFKELLQTSAPSSDDSKTSSGDSSQSSSSNTHSAETSTSVEVDLAMLGVEIYTGEASEALKQDILLHGSAKERASLSTNFISFWDDAGVHGDAGLR